ncbi:NADPH:quinone reductase [Microdochium nivale]|nr:NADPH:quinone reductase [Microdochium nivale]
MKAVVINKFVDSYDEVIVSNVAKPVPKDDELLIRVEAAGVNFVDTLYARGKHQNNKRHVKPPFTLGLEFSGTVVSVPASFTAFSPGDRVMGDFAGAYAEYITYPSALAASSSLHRVPRGWTHAESAGLAATLPVSYGALDACGGAIGPGTTVLVHAAAGGLGLAAVQIASALGATVIGTAGGPDKCRVAERFGAAACVDYTADDEWWEAVLDLTGPERRGVDVVFDSVGLVDLSLKCIAHRGGCLSLGSRGGTG